MKRLPISFISGLAALVLLLAPFAPASSVAANTLPLADGTDNVRGNVYCEQDELGDWSAREDVYGEYCEGYEYGYWYGDGHSDGYNDAYYGDEYGTSYPEFDLADGYDKGYQDAYLDGYAEGYAEGLEERKDEIDNVDEYAHSYGYDAGYYDGYYGEKYYGDLKDYESSFGAEYDEKYVKAYAEGYAEGYSEGAYQASVVANSYDSLQIEDNVTGETYDSYYIRGNSVNELADNKGNIKLDNTRNVFIDKDAINNLKDSLTVNTPTGSSIVFPKKALLEILKSNNGENINFSLGNASAKYSDALSEAIEFNVYSDGERFTGKLDVPVQITFKVDTEKVKNWNDLVLRYVDSEGNEKDYTNQIVSVNPETGEVVAKVFHFSTYYIAEVEGSEASKGVIITNGKGGPGDIDNGQGGLGDTLPPTATNAFNLLLAGSVILLAGFASLFIRRKKVL